MSKNFYSEIHLHIVWHTKLSLPLLTPTIRSIAYASLSKRISSTSGVMLHAIGGIENHVHIAVRIPPTLNISHWIGQLKGGSTHDVNHMENAREAKLQWQTGYGVVSFGSKDLPWVISYVQNQEQRHANQKTNPRLEDFN